MKHSDSIKNLTKALLEAQKNIGSAKKDSKNPFFKSNYADLPTVMEVVKQPLNEAGVFVLQPASHRDGKNFIETILVHGESGEFMSSETEVVCAKANDPQAFGAAQTYARRFGLQAMLFVPSEDDDGNVAAGRSAPTQYAKPVASAAPVAAQPKQDDQSQPVAATVAPLKSSNFRKAKAVVEKTTSGDDWS